MLQRLDPPAELLDRVYESLLEGICTGALAPGERFTQEALAARLGVSRQPVLQALLLLRRQGLIRDTDNRRGVVVAPLDREFVVHLYRVRAALDGLAAASASAHFGAERVAKARALIAEGRQASASGDAGTLSRLDLAFHGILYEASGNPVLIDTARQNAHHTRRVIAAYLREPRASSAGVWDEHETILEAVARGDAAAAERLSRQHAERAASVFLAHPETLRQRSQQR